MKIRFCLAFLLTVCMLFIVLPAGVSAMDARSRLSQKDQSVYDSLKSQIESVASGAESSTHFEVACSGFQSMWTLEELGASDADDGMDKLLEKMGQFCVDDPEAILSALMADLPYDLYWYDKTASTVRGVEGGVTGRTYSTGEVELFPGCYDPDNPTDTVTLTYYYELPVSSDYGGGYTVTRTAQIRTQAQTIVNRYDGQSDYQKLLGYVTEICGMTAYNSAAASNSSTPYGDPWQPVYVFDGDNDTNVVCEGYAKAFKYLCDLTEFNSSLVDCCLVTGDMSGGTGAGPHMWNVVTMENGENYLIDVTNCDSHNDPTFLFLKGSAPIAAGQFTFEGITYTYDDETTDLWPSSLLTLAASDYVIETPDPEIVDSGTCGNDLTWTLYESGLLEIAGTGDMWDYPCSSSWDDAGVLHVENTAPWHDYANGAIESLVLGDEVTGIGQGAFAGCTSLSSVNLAEAVSLSVIGADAFQATALTEVTIPESVTEIFNCAFADCAALASVTFADGIQLAAISDGVFKWTALTTVEIPASVTEIRVDAFADCHDLETVTFAVDGALGVIGAYAFGSTALNDVTIPASVTNIETAAFEYCGSLTSVTFAEDGALEVIGAHAFGSTALNEVTIPASVTNIDTAAFEYCGSLTSVTFAADGALEVIGSAAFHWSGLTSVEIPASVVSTGRDCFAYSYDLETVTFAEGSCLTTLGRASFYVPYMEADDEHGECIPALCGNLVLPDSLEEIGEMAFTGNRFTTITVGENVSAIGYSAFESYDGSLEKATFLGDAPTRIFGNDGAEPADDEEREAWTNSIFAVASEDFVIEYYSDKNGWDDIWEGVYTKVAIQSDPMLLHWEFGTVNGGEWTGEDADKLWDGDPATKFCTHEANAYSVVRTESGEAVTVTGMILRTGNDSMECGGRLPESWALYGTNDDAVFGLAQAEWTGNSLNYDAPADDGWTLIASGDSDTFLRLNDAEFVVTDVAEAAAKYFCFVIDGISSIPPEDVACVQLSEITLLTGGSLPEYQAAGPLAEELTWSVDWDGVLTIDGKGEMGDVLVPNEQGILCSPWMAFRDRISAVVIEDAVTSVSGGAFAGPVWYDEDTETWLNTPAFREGTALALGSGIETVGEGAFTSSGFSSFTLPDTLTEIADSAFSFNPMTEVTIPADVTVIGNCAFEYCGALETVTFAENAAFGEIGAFAFNVTALTEVTIPASVTRIGTGAFTDCTSLESVTFAADAALEVIGESAFRSSGLTSVEIPASVTCIEDGAFASCTSLESVIFTADGALEEIGAYAFTRTALTSVEIPASVTGIEEGAFEDCHDLTAVTFAADGALETIGGSAFRWSGLTSVEIPASVMSTGRDCFAYSYDLETVTFAEGSCLTNLGRASFYVPYQEADDDHGECIPSLCGDLVLPDSLEEIGELAFTGNRFTTITVGENVSAIGYAAFESYDGSLETATFLGDAPTRIFGDGGAEPADAEELEAWTNSIFGNASEDFVIEYYSDKNGWDDIWEGVYDKIAINPGNVVIESGMCGDDLTWILYEGGILEITGNGDMWDYPCSLYLDEDAKALHVDNTAPWHEYANDAIETLILGDGVTGIGKGAFAGCTSLRSVNLEEAASLRVIGEDAFQVTALTEVTIPASVTEIWNCAFADCYDLASVTFADGIQLAAISDGVFKWTALTNVTIPASVTEIHVDAFASCHDLAYVFFAADGALEEIGPYAFAWTALTEATIPASVTEICKCAFAECSDLASVTFADGIQLTEIGDGAFKWTALTGVEIPASVKTICEDAFAYCHDLTSVTFAADGGLGEIGACAFARTALASVEVPATVTSIGEGAFEDCHDLTAVTFAADGMLETIGDSAFRWSGLTSVEIPASVMSTGRDCFAYSYDLETVTFAEGSCLTNLGRASFYVPYLEADDEHGECIPVLCGNLVLPDSLEVIGELAFTGNRFTTVTIGPNVSAIGFSAFESYDGSLEKATFLGDAPTRIFGDDGAEPADDEEREAWMNSIFGNASEDFVIEYFCDADSWDDIWEGIYSKTVIHVGDEELQGDEEATCEEEGYTGDLVCSACGTILEEGSVIPPLGHDWEISYAWSDDYGEVTASAVCRTDPSHEIEETVTTDCTVIVEPTPEEEGLLLYTAIFENDCFSEQTEEVSVPPTGYTYGDPVFAWTDDGHVTVTVPAHEDPAGDLTLTEEDGNVTVTAETTAATCEEDGMIVYTAAVDFDGTIYTDTHEITLPATGHDWDLPAYVWANDCSAVTATRVCRKDGSHVETETVGTTGEVTKPATYEEMGETTYTAEFSNIAFATQTRTVADIDVLPVPVAVTVQPADQIAAVGDTVTMSVRATGTDLTYQWQYKKKTATAWTNASGKTEDWVLTVASVHYGFDFRCKVTDGKGETVYSDIVHIDPALAITIQPTDQIAAVGDMVTMSVRATGTDLAYQWQYRNKTATAWTNASGKTADWVLTVASVHYDFDFRCLVTDGTGAAIYSDIVHIDPALGITVQPNDHIAAVGDKVTMSVRATGTDLTYQWQFKNKTATAWTNASGKTEDWVLTVASVHFGFDFRCVVMDGTGETVYSDIVHIYPALTITVQPTDQIAKVGDKVTMSVRATGTDLTYQWQYRNKTATAWTNASGKTADWVLTVASVHFDYDFRCVVTDGSGAAINSDIVHIDPALGITVQPNDHIAAVGEKVTMSVRASGTDLTYQWQYRKKTATAWTNASGKTEDWVLTVASVHYGFDFRCAVTDGTGETVYSDIVRINPALAITVQPTNQIAAVGDRVTMSVRASGTDLTYQWQYRKKTATAWTNASGKTEDWVLTVASVHYGFDFRCAVTDGTGETVYSDIVRINPALAITVQPTNQIAAVGDRVTMSVRASGTDLTYQWQYKKKTAAAWTNASGKTEDWVLTVASVHYGFDFRCAVTDGTGETVYSDIVHIYPALAITLQPTDQIAKVGDKVTMSVRATGTDLTYQWQYRNKTAAAWTNANGKTADWLLTVASVHYNFDFRCVVTDGTGAAIYSDIVHVDPALGITVQPNDHIAAVGEKVTMSVRASGTDLTYQWQYRKKTATAWTNASGKTADWVLTVASVHYGFDFRCAVTDAEGETVYTDTVHIYKS